MKASRIGLIAVVLGSLVVSSPIASAQTTKAKASKVDKIATKLSLTDEQKKKLEPIYKDYADKSAALAAKTDLSKEQKKAEKTKLKDAFAAKVKDSKILTDDQYKEWLASRTKAPAAKKPQSQN